MKKKFLTVFLIILAALCFVVGISACNVKDDSVSLDGTYYVYRNEKYEKDNYIKISGSNWEDDDGTSGTWERDGNNLSFNGTVFGMTDEIYSGTYISDGVLKIKIFGADVYYCKEGKKPDDSSSQTNNQGGNNDGNQSGNNNSPSQSVQKYTVTYDANGGKFANGETFTQEAGGNSLLTAPTQPTRDRYTFGGWAKDKNGQNMWQFATDKVTQNVTLYAVWQEPSATILSVEGASIKGNEILMIVSPSTEKVILSNKVICSSDSGWKLYYDSMGQTEIPTRVAANLNGSLSNGDNEFYIVVTSLNNAQVNTYKLIVHRQFKATISYYDNKGVLINSTTALTGETFSAAYTPSIRGYQFNYWQYKNGGKFQTDVIYESLNLYANVTAKTYKITLNVNGGDELSSTEKTVTYDKSYSLPKPTKTGYSFLGWGYNSSNSMFTDNKGASLENWTGTSDTTLYAKWQVNQYTVTLNKDLSEGGSVSGGGDHTYDSQVTITASTYSGYTWCGWYKGTEQVSTELSYKFKMGLDVTYTAKWIKYPVTLERSDTAAGTVSGVDKTVLGEQTTITAKSNLGYTFVGWYNGDNQVSTEPTYTFKLEETPVTYTAKWRVSDEMSNFIFTSTQTAFKITGIKNKDVTSIVVPDYVTEISERAFRGCSNLESITLPFVGGSIKTANETYQYPFGYIFGTSSYSGASAVKQYYYGSSTSSTTNSTYYIPDSLKTVTITGGNILYGAFYNCESLESVTLGDSVTPIGEQAFYHCTGLASITIPDSVTSIGYGTFSGCSSLESITLPFVGDSVKSPTDTYQYPFGYIFGKSSYSGASAVKQYYYGSSTSSTTYDTYYIPDSLKTVTITGGNICGNILLYGAFYNCESLESVTLGDSVTSIGGWAFSGCAAEIKWGDNPSIKEIGNYAFGGYKGTSITIPDSVTSIDYHAFYNFTSLESIIIPDSVTSISYEAFSGCTSLESITIPESVTTIGISAFENCTSLTTVYWDATNCESAGSYSYPIFSGCTALTTVHIGENVEEIPQYTFDNCTNLESITIPDSVTSIGYEAFKNCTSLKSITFGNNSKLETIGNSAFYNCASLTSINFGNNSKLETIGSSAFYNCASLTSITIPDSVTSIGRYAFSGCTKIIQTQDGVQYVDKWVVVVTSVTSVNLREDTKGIAAYAFSNYKGTNITIPDSVTSIGWGAFGGCSSLTTVYWNATNCEWAGGYSYNGDNVTINDNTIFKGCTALTTVQIGEKVEKIPAYAFYNCTNLESITIPDSVTSIGYEAFRGCSSLTGVYITDLKAWCNIDFGSDDANPLCYAHNLNLNDKPVTEITADMLQGVKTIKDYAFYKCTSLGSVTIPDSVTSIGEDAFYKCTSLGKVIIGNGVTSIGRYAFSGCSSLTGVYITDLKAWCNIEFGSSSANPLSYAYNLYLNDELVTDITADMLQGATAIKDYAFSDCTSLESIIIPDSVTSIGSEAFSGCSSLESITLPFVGGSKNATTASESTLFGYIFGTSSYSGGEAIDQRYSSSSNDHVIYYIPDSLKTVTITGGNILYGAFYNCESLDSITIPDSVTSIGEYAFYHCTGLASITIPDNVTSIGSYAFRDCIGLASITFDNSSKLETIGDHAFYDCTSLESITIPESVTSIGRYAFSGCNKIIQIEADARYVDKWIVERIDFSNVKNATIKANTKGIADGAFSGCTSLESITIPDSVISISYEAFSGCTSLKSITVDLNNKNYSSQDGILYDKNKTILIQCPQAKTSVNIPDSVTSIGSSAFYYCTSLTSITIPDSVTSIGEYAFSGCTAEIKWGDNPSIKEIGNYAFSGYEGTSITIPDSVTSIGEYAFRGCTSFKSITIPASVTSIGSEAFYGCSSLKGVYITDLGAWCNIEFGSSYANPLYYAHNLYLNKKLVTNITADMLQGVTEIKDYVFYKCTSLTSITIPDSVTSIGEYAFRGCTSFKSITVDLNNKNYSSQDGILYDKNKTILIQCPRAKTSVNIPASVTSIGSSAFYYCTSLTSITIPDSVTSIGEYAFSGCTSLKSITIPDSVTSIGEYAFSGCTSLKSITIPDSVTSIGEYAFSGCTSLKSMYYGGNLTEWSSIISIGNYNFELFKATRYYFSATAPNETKWAKSENWWHYDPKTGGIAIWEKSK